MNLGKCAGAGIDQTFTACHAGAAMPTMTISGETRVPEALHTTYLKLKPFFQSQPRTGDPAATHGPRLNPASFFNAQHHIKTILY